MRKTKLYLLYRLCPNTGKLKPYIKRHNNNNCKLKSKFYISKTNIKSSSENSRNNLMNITLIGFSAWANDLANLVFMPLNT